jgi:hypothetical protein
MVLTARLAMHLNFFSEVFTLFIASRGQREQVSSSGMRQLQAYTVFRKIHMVGVGVVLNFSCRSVCQIEWG